MLLILITLATAAITGRPKSPLREPLYLLPGILGVALWFLATLAFG